MAMGIGPCKATCPLEPALVLFGLDVAAVFCVLLGCELLFLAWGLRVAVATAFDLIPSCCSRELKSINSLESRLFDCELLIVLVVLVVGWTCGVLLYGGGGVIGC